MGDSVTQEREDLEQLVSTPGWMRFLNHVRREWGNPEDGGGQRFMVAHRQVLANTNDTDALSQMRQIAVAQREIHTLISWVEETLKAAQKAEAVPPATIVPMYQRRGGL